MEKIVITACHSKLYPQKLYQCHLLKLLYCMQNFVRFHAMESETTITIILGKIE